MRRVAVTGLGIVSSIGSNKEEVRQSLRAGRSGIAVNPEYQELRFRCHLDGPIRLDLKRLIDRKLYRFMSQGAACSYLAMREAVADAGLPEDVVSAERTGLIVGSGGSSTEQVVNAADILRQRGVRRVGPYMVPRTMASTASACLATAFKIKGVSYAISSACSTSAHCIGHGAELIRMGKQDLVFAGGAEDVHWTTTLLFDAMGALSSKYNDTPETASRAFDATRDGFVMSGGGGVVVLEELEHARRRGAKVYAELAGYGATSDGHDMVQPSGEGAVRCMRQAMHGLDQKIDYVNAHATSTPVGDLRELGALREVFGDDMPALSATKSLTGHALGAAGVHEAIYCLLMMESGFICASANIQELDPTAVGMPIVRERQDDVRLDLTMSNSFGFGGVNATLVLKRLAD